MEGRLGESRTRGGEEVRVQRGEPRRRLGRGPGLRGRDGTGRVRMGWQAPGGL